jgi:hypothetical protein
VELEVPHAEDAKEVVRVELRSLNIYMQGLSHGRNVAGPCLVSLADHEIEAWIAEAPTRGMQDKGAVRSSLGAEDDGSVAIRKREHDPDARTMMPGYLDDGVITYCSASQRRVLNQGLACASDLLKDIAG